MGGQNKNKKNKTKKIVLRGSDCLLEQLIPGWYIYTLKPGCAMTAEYLSIYKEKGIN